MKRRIGEYDHTCRACRYSARSIESLSRMKAATKAWQVREREKFLVLRKAESARRRRRLGMRTMDDVRVKNAAQMVVRDGEHRRAVEERSSARAAARAAKPWLADGLSAAERWRLRYECDPDFNLRERLRTALRHRKEGVRLAERIREALKTSGRSRAIERKLGYSIAQLGVHLERQFGPGMDWPIFLTGRIHIDHILPLSGFDLADPAELRAAWALSNLRPMWAEGNIAKGANRTLLI